jgi:hypothetical protein
MQFLLALKYSVRHHTSGTRVSLSPDLNTARTQCECGWSLDPVSQLPCLFIRALFKATPLGSGRFYAPGMKELNKRSVQIV